MAFIHSPNIVTNGLVLCFDAANQKSYGPTTVEALVVAGGGGGGMDMGGGGGGGGLLYGSALTIAAGTAYPIIVGAGGYGGPAGGGGYRTDGAGPQPSFHQFTISATSGGNSSFSSLTAIGGGYGGSSYWGYTPNYGLGAAGGSGGGASGYSNGTSGSGGGAGTAGQGNRGGNVGGQYYSGGGGGAGAAGADGTNQAHGGIGVYNDILGIGYYWAGGGGGAAYSLSAGGNGGLGGAGGGGVGTTYGGEGINNGAGGGGGSPNSQTNKPGGNAGANTGGGGGGGSHYNLTNKGGEGGSGIVVIRYAGVQKATGGTITTVGNYTVHTFTTSGTFTTGANWGDLSGNNITGVLTNGPTYSSANSGSIVFDGVNDYSAIDVSFVSQNLISRTWEAFVKPAVTLTSSGIIGTALSDGCTYYCNGGICIWSGNYAFNWYDNAAYQFLDSGVAATAGVYAHVVGTWNGTDNKARIYVNGVLKNTGAASNLNYGGYANRIQIAYLSASGNYLNGSLGNLKLYYNKVLSDTEVLQNFNALRGRYEGIGLSPSTPAISAAEIKANNPSVQSGVYWLYSTGINSGTPFQCYCDFTMDGGIGYAIYFQQYFDSTDDGGTAGYEYGPTFTSMQSTAITGISDYRNEFNVYPNLMPIQYNNGAGATRMIVYNRTNTGAAASGIQGATNYKWTRISGITATNMRDIWTSFAATAQYTVSFVSAGNSGRTSGSGTGYIQGSHGSSGGVYQWVANASGNVNDYLIFEYKPNANPADPNHYWMVDTGVSGSIYFRANGEYGASGVFQTRYGGIAIY